MNDGTSQEAFIQRMRDECEIKEKLLKYCRGVDRRDYELVRSVYHSDAIDMHGGYNGGIDGLLDWMAKRHETVEQSMHLLGNCLIEWVEGGATVETYCVTYQRVGSVGSAAEAGFQTGGPRVQTQVRCRYVDKFTWREGEWRIQNRVVVYESLVMEEYLSNESAFSPSMKVATRGPDDPLYCEAPEDLPA